MVRSSTYPFLLGAIFLFTGGLSLSGQSLIRDINPGASSAQINDKIAYGSKVYMMGDDGTNGAELWVSDGTFGGTSMEMNIYSGSGNGYPANFVNMNGKVYFRADHISYGFEIWEHDTLTGTTSLLLDANPGPSDGVYTTTTFRIVESNGRLYMPLDEGVYGRELWTSDGTPGGTIRLLDTYVGSSSGINGAGDPKEITPFGAGILFSSYDYDLGTGIGLGRELYRSNGTVATTAMVMDINPGIGSSSPDNFLTVGSLAFFSANDGTNGDELWRTNGTPGGTSMILDINPGFGGSAPANLARVGSEILFYADDGVHGKELWKTDGTPGGTVLVKDIYPGSSSSEVSSLAKSNFIELNGLLLFTANDGTNGREVWISDGTEAGTQMLRDIYPGSFSSYADYYVVYDGIAYFYANDGTNGYELWATDGTASRTQMLADINPGSGSGSPNDFVRIGDMMVFTANTTPTGSELFGLDLSTVVLPSLPVELLDFQAEATPEGRVALSWQTASETQNHYFEVERTNDAGSFEPVVRVAGKGTTQSLSSYEALDESPLTGNRFYRLKQVDLDGSVHYSHMVQVYIAPANPLMSVTPNPATDRVWVEVEQGHMPAQLTLLNLQGKVVAQYIPTQQQTTLSISLEGLATGLYFLQARTAEGRQVVRIRKI